MIAQTIPKISALEAQATADRFLSAHLPEYFRAGEPAHDQTAQTWCVPVLLDYRYANPFGEVGQLVINAFAAEVISHTPLAEMEKAGRNLYWQHFKRNTAVLATPENPAAALEVEAIAGGFLIDHLPDRFSNSAPRWDEASGQWKVPVILAYPRIGSVGEVGELAISAACGEVISHTPFAEIRERARALYDQRRDEIEAAFLSAGN